MVHDERGRDDPAKDPSARALARTSVPAEPGRGERERDVRERDERTREEPRGPAPGLGPYGPGHWAWRDDPRRFVPEHLRPGKSRPEGRVPRGEDSRLYDDEVGQRRDEAERGRERESPSYAGLGPSRYRRSDEKIYDDVNQRLTDHPAVDARDVEVFVEDGVVTMKGQVPTRAMKLWAEDAARLTTGVREVRNELQIASGPRPGDAVPTREVGHDTDVLPGMRVVDVNGDRVGEVKSVQDETFHLDRPLKRDLYVPLRAVREVTDDQVLLQYRAEDMDDMGWDTPELLGSKRPPK